MIDKLIDGILSVVKNIQKIITSFFVIISIVASLLYAGANKDVQRLKQALSKKPDTITKTIYQKVPVYRTKEVPVEVVKTVIKEVPIEVIKEVPVMKETVKYVDLTPKGSKWGLIFGVNPLVIGINYKLGKLDLCLDFNGSKFGLLFSRKL